MAFQLPQSVICQICQDSLLSEGNIDVFSTTCGHVFHAPCITNWLNGNGNGTGCPNCYARIRVNLCKKLFLSVDQEDNQAVQRLNQVENMEVRYATLESQLTEKERELLAEQREKNDLFEETLKLKEDLAQKDKEIKTLRMKLEAKVTSPPALLTPVVALKKVADPPRRVTKASDTVPPATRKSARISNSSSPSPQVVYMRTAGGVAFATEASQSRGPAPVELPQTRSVTASRKLFTGGVARRTSPAMALAATPPRSSVNSAAVKRTASALATVRTRLRTTPTTTATSTTTTNEGTSGDERPRSRILARSKTVSSAGRTLRPVTQRMDL